MNEMTFISVILPLKLEWEPCYCLPEDICPEDVHVGSRVKVRFANRGYSGVVGAVGVVPETDPSRIKPIDSVETGLESIFPQEIELWRRVADYYMCTVGEVYKAAYPVGKINLEETHAAAVSRAVQRREKLLDAMRQKVSRIEDRLKRKQELIDASRDGTKAKQKYLDDAVRIRRELEMAIEALLSAERNESSEHEAASEYELKPVCLSQSQNDAYSKIKDAFSTSKPVMLHGVTGSGKTEIYIRLAQDVISKGGNVLYLVPEIALSRQLEDRLYAHFGDRLSIFHSAETAASRRNVAEKVRSGQGYVVLGTRSSLFLPHHGLGLVIVDEEHDGSYKQDSPSPRYNGRDTALMLSAIHGSSIILGSATPSLEELYNCECGRHALVKLMDRYHGTEDSEIELIDTKAERRKRGMVGNFSRKLIAHMEKALAEGGQVMILRSRRSWAPALQCDSCGEIPKCPHCNVSLSRHKSGGDRLVCHYCGTTIQYMDKCARCSGELRPLGAGTQKIEEEVSALFPGAKVARLDSDTAQNKTYETKTIKAFADGEIDILVGTQMVTKGFDFGNLSLVAVIAADAFLGMQDFRADEKAAQIIGQFRGRTGRRGRKGLMVIQTSQPEHPVYQRIISGDAPEFHRDMLVERKDFGFPPYMRMIEISVRGYREEKVIRVSSDMAAALSGVADVIGPYSPAVDKVADQFVRIVRISLRKDRNLYERKDKIRKIVNDMERVVGRDCVITVNVDPS